MTSRGYEPGDFALMLGLVSELWPDGRHAIGYAFMSQRLPYPDWEARLWFDGDTLAGFGWATGWRDRRGLSYEYRDVALLPQIVEWARPDLTTVKSGDEESAAVLRDHGFVEDPAAQANRWNVRTLEAIEGPRAPDGYRLATMAEHTDFASRSAAHRSAFTRPGATSRFTDEVYAAVRSEAPWRGDLDCVAVGPDGEVAAYALAWLDDRHGVGELEPVGTRVEHQRKGLGRAVCLYALHRLRDAGAHTALVGSSQAGPQRLYESIGFRERWHDVVYVRAEPVTLPPSG